MEGSGGVLGRFGEDFQRIFGRFQIDLRVDFDEFVDYSYDLFEIFKARLLHDLERPPLIRATKQTSIDR